MTAGERWAREQLDDLRAARFTATAWARFLVASHRRAADTRRERPHLARQARGWSILGLCAGLAFVRWAPRARVPAPRAWTFGLWWLTVSAMLDWHLGMVEGDDGEKRERLSPADALTLQRLWLIPLLAAQSDPAQGSRSAFSALLASAWVTDTLDGDLARRVGTTRLGRDLDKAADALLVGVAARAASRSAWLPPRATRRAVTRSVFLLAYVAASYLRTGRRPRVDSLGRGRELGPVLLAGLAAAPFSSRTGAALTSTASVASLALGVVQPRSKPARGPLPPRGVAASATVRESGDAAQAPFQNGLQFQ